MNKPSQEAIAAGRWQAFDAIEKTADLTASYARSIGEAAYRRDQVTVGVHIKQLRLCVLSMIKLYKEGLESDQNLPERGRSNGADRAGEQAGDGMGGDQSQ